MNLRITKIYEDAILPTRKHYNDAGLDLYLYLPDNYPERMVTLEGSGIFVYQTGIRVAIPEEYVGLVWPKSRSDFSIGGGVIDSGYRGEILVKIIKSYSGQLVLHHGDAIAQLLIQPISIPNLLVQETEEFDKDKTDRGETGGIVSQISQLEKLEFENDFGIDDLK